jgi:hypothetical protein
MAKAKKAGKKPGAKRSNLGKAKVYRAAATKRRVALVPKKSAKKAAKAAEPKLSPKLTKKAEEFNRKAETLMERGRGRGFVTYDEILKSFPTSRQMSNFLKSSTNDFLNCTHRRA